jgi:concentrative nucleoside transporter, CNT family
MMGSRLTCVVGLLVMIGVAWLLSTDRRRFPLRIVAGGLALQMLLAFLILKTSKGQQVFDQVGEFFQRILGFVNEGSGFLFSSAGSTSLIETFAFGVLPTVIFFSALMNVLYHIGVMQWIVWAMAWVMRFSLGTSGAETLAAAANVFVGHTEAPLVVKPYLATMTRSELNALMTGGFATVTGGLLGAYAGMGIDIKHLLTASVISAPAALLIAKVLVPETEPVKDSQSLTMNQERTSVNLIGAAVQGATDGLKLALNVGAVLIAFLALIAMLDWTLAQTVNSVLWAVGVAEDQRPTITLGVLLGYACAPLALCMGIPIGESVAAGELIGLKTVANEFIAYQKLGAIDVTGDAAISPRTKVVLTYALAGFSNLSAIGIQVGGIGGLEPKRKDDLAKLGLRAMFGGLLACCMTGSIAGLMLADADVVVPPKLNATEQASDSIGSHESPAPGEVEELGQ